MSFVKGIFNNNKKRDETGSAGINGSPGSARRSPANARRSPAGAVPKSRDMTSPKQSTPKNHREEERNGHEYEPTQEELAMKLPFKDKSSKRDKNLSISRSGRHKYKNKQRMSVLQQDIYSDIPADQKPPAKSDTPTGGSGGSGNGSGSKGGYRGMEAHSKQFQSHKRPALSIGGASAAV